MERDPMLREPADCKVSRSHPAADCHFHVIDHTRFPFPGGMGYTPRRDESGSFEELLACMARNGITHGLAVQPSGYGFDNAALLDALERGRGRVKGVAVGASRGARGRVAPIVRCRRCRGTVQSDRFRCRWFGTARGDAAARDDGRHELVCRGPMCRRRFPTGGRAGGEDRGAAADRSPGRA